MRLHYFKKGTQRMPSYTFNLLCVFLFYSLSLKHIVFLVRSYMMELERSIEDEHLYPIYYND